MRHGRARGRALHEPRRRPELFRVDRKARGDAAVEGRELRRFPPPRGAGLPADFGNLPRTRGRERGRGDARRRYARGAAPLRRPCGRPLGLEDTERRRLRARVRRGRARAELREASGIPLRAAGLTKNQYFSPYIQKSDFILQYGKFLQRGRIRRMDDADSCSDSSRSCEQPITINTRRRDKPVPAFLW